MKKQTDIVLSVRLPKELDTRLAKAAKKLDLFKNDISRDAVRAAVAAIEAHQYRVQIPMEIAVKPQVAPGSR